MGATQNVIQLKLYVREQLLIFIKYHKKSLIKLVAKINNNYYINLYKGISLSHFKMKIFF